MSRSSTSDSEHDETSDEDGDQDQDGFIVHEPEVIPEQDLKNKFKSNNEFEVAFRTYNRAKFQTWVTGRADRIKPVDNVFVSTDTFQRAQAQGPSLCLSCSILSHPFCL
ncbi:hypothetical protein RvY_15308 [Ramazzottius varieornatus]|uniref:Uncharacterized protein n=1 Tax=Ramazzottius varieornatus TaxID=947166 RepID=A0A1D1VUF2_RAMVA|nr:hypothetical protein RvY_15308 [Ramazzottius varieornatus]